MACHKNKRPRNREMFCLVTFYLNLDVWISKSISTCHSFLWGLCDI